MEDCIEYIISLFVEDASLINLVQYGWSSEEDKPNAVIKIFRSNFFDDGIYGTEKTKPCFPLKTLPNSDIPFLYGDSTISRDEAGIIWVGADIIASAYYMLSRYEELINTKRDEHGRFCAKYSYLFNAGYGLRPLVDEYGEFIRKLLKQNGIPLHDNLNRFNKIWMTHDLDVPFKYYTFEKTIKQCIKNLLKITGHNDDRPLNSYFCKKNDPYYTYERLQNVDNYIMDNCGKDTVTVIYFVIAGNGKKYCSINSLKYLRLLKHLKDNGACMGIHLSYEVADNNSFIKKEVDRIKKKGIIEKNNVRSRNHYLRWIDTKDVFPMIKAGIQEDFTLGFHDCVGFRMGTCKSYYYIEPQKRLVTNLKVVPMQIMESTLSSMNYMSLSKQNAIEMSIKVIDEVYKHGGELNILFHNTIDESYHEVLYEEIAEYIVWKNKS